MSDSSQRNRDTLSEFQRGLRAGRVLIAGCLVLGALFGLALNAWMPPVYRATARLEIRRPIDPPLSSSGGFQSENVALYTTAMLITNRTLLEQLDHDLSSRDWLDPGVWGDRPRARIHALARSAAAGIGGWLRTPLPLPASVVRATPEDRVDWLDRIVHVEPVQDTRLVDIKVEHPDPQAALGIADRLAERFVAYASARVPAPAVPAISPSPVERDLAAIVPAAQVAGAVADSLADTVSVKALLRQLDDRVANLTDQLVRTEADDAVARARLERCAGWTRDSLVDGRALPVESPGLGALRQELVERQMELASARQVYGAMHPRMRALESELAVLQISADRELQRAVAEARAEHDALATRAAALRGDLGRSEQALAVCERRLPSAAPPAPEPLPPPVEIVDSATLAPQPIRPHRLMNLAACLLASGLVGCGLATYRYSGRRTIDTPEDVEEELQLPVLGIVPRNA